MRAAPAAIALWLSPSILFAQNIRAVPVEVAVPLSGVAGSAGTQLVSPSAPGMTPSRAMALRTSPSLSLRLPAARAGRTGSSESSDLAGAVERLTAENAALKEQLAAKDRFMRTAVHDMSSPLTVLDGNLQLIEMSADGLSERHRLDVAAARKSSTRLIGMVRSILEFSRSGAADAPIERAPVDLGAMVRETAEGLTDRAAQKGVRVEVDVPGDAAGTSGDAGLLRRLVENLVSNGIKYNKDGGGLAVSLRSVPGGKVLIVQDEGIGIAAEDLPKLFGPFFRSDAVRGKIAGNGLGLASVKAIAERHGGRVAVESVPGHGTTFRVFLPD